MHMTSSIEAASSPPPTPAPADLPVTTTRPERPRAADAVEHANGTQGESGWATVNPVASGRPLVARDPDEQPTECRYEQFRSPSPPDDLRDFVDIIDGNVCPVTSTAVAGVGLTAAPRRSTALAAQGYAPSALLGAAEKMRLPLTVTCQKAAATKTK
jgi:hypothetical protein